METNGFCEVLVPVAATPLERNLSKVLLGAGILLILWSVLSLLAGGMALVFGLLAVACLAGSLVCRRTFQVEFEYQYVEGTLTIDRIVAQTRRKRLAQFELENLYLAAPEGDERLRPYQKGDRPVEDYTSRNPQAPNRYQLVFPQQVVLLEPTEAMVRLLWRSAPSKVVRKQS